MQGKFNPYVELWFSGVRTFQDFLESVNGFFQGFGMEDDVIIIEVERSGVDSGVGSRTGR